MEKFQTADGKIYVSNSKSPDGKYVILWAYTDTKPHVKIIHNNIEKFTIFIKNPRKCEIANNGNFMILDEGNTTFYTKILIYNIEKEKLIDKTFHLGYFNIGLSKEGNYGICQLANHDSSPYSNKLILFNIKEKTIQWNINSFFWADNYLFDENKMIVEL